MLRHRQLYPYLLFVALSVALATTLTTPRTAQSGGPVRAPFLTAVSKNGVDLELRSEGKIMADEMASGHVMLGPEVPPIQNFFAGQGRNPLRGPNTQVNDPALDNIQIFPGFRPFLHFTQSETTVAAVGWFLQTADSAQAAVVRSMTSGTARWGMVKVNVLPWPGVLFTQIRPPCISTSRREIARPNPVPWYLPLIPL